MRIGDKDHSDCVTIGLEISHSSKRKQVCGTAKQRRQFTTFLIRACRAGKNPNSHTIGEWCDLWRAA